jgi:hypothetical protein
VRECSVLLHNIVLQENIHDPWRWLLDPSHGYTMREAYRFLTNNWNFVDRTLVDDIWHKHIPSKVTLFVWSLLRNRLPTKDILVRRRVLQVHDLECVFSCGANETANHLVRFGLMCYTGWVYLQSYQVTFDSILFNLLTWQDCLEPHTRS